MQGALSSMQQITALKDYAAANGISLDDDELAAIDADLASAESSAKLAGFSNLNNFFAAQFGTGVNAATVRRLTADSQLASKALQQYSDSLTYTSSRSTMPRSRAAVTSLTTPTTSSRPRPSPKRLPRARCPKPS